MRAKIESWLKDHDHRLERFATPIPTSVASGEIGISVEELLKNVSDQVHPMYHTWEHIWKGKKRRSKPYCLRANGPGTLGLDWEDSVVGAAVAEFQRAGFDTKLELGSDLHISQLLEEPDLQRLESGTNLRDLWALRKSDGDVELYIVEAKGKEAHGFDYYSFAEVLAQVFEVSEDPLTELLGSERGPGHGLCWQFGTQIHEAWTAMGLNVTVTLAVLVPDWAPDIVWDNGKPRRLDRAFYERPISALDRFVKGAESEADSGRFKYDRAFGRVLDELELRFEIRKLMQELNGIRFRVLRATDGAGIEQFKLRGFSGS